MYKLVTAPLTKAVSLAEAKTHLRVLDTSEDTYIQGIIDAAQEIAESYTNRAFISSTWSYTLDEFPGYIRIMKSSVTAINSVKYIDGDGVEQTLDPTKYGIRYSDPAVIAPLKAWPGTEYGLSKITVEFVAGWADAASVPASIKAAMYLIIAHLYDNRSDVVEGRTVNELPQGSKYLLNQWRVFEF